MQALRQLGSSFLVGAISLLLIVGGLSTTLAEKNIDAPPPTITKTSIPTSVSVDIKNATLSTPGLLPTAVIPVSPTATATIPASSVCPAPTGWLPYIVKVGESLSALATRYGTTTDMLQAANCLVGTSLLPGTQIYVPHTPTLTPIPCGAPYGWIHYSVKTGDNLYRISLGYRVSVAQLQSANCLGYSTQIKVGQKLYVPNVVTSTPAITNTPSPKITQTGTATIFSSTATSTSTATSLPSETPTATGTESQVVPSQTPTATSTNTLLPTATFTVAP